MRWVLGRTGVAPLWVVALGCGATLAACDSKQVGSSKPQGKAAATTSLSGPQPLRAPKVRTGTVELAGHCDKAYSVDVEDGGIVECTVMADLQVGDVTCAKDSRPQTYDDRSLRSCAVQGVLAAGGLECRDAVYFYPDGTIQTCQLAKPVRHLGKRCETRVEFNTDGGFRECF